MSIINMCQFPYNCFFRDKTVISKLLDPASIAEEKAKTLY